MKKKGTISIPATENLSKVLEKVADKLYEEWSESEVTNLEKSRKWVMGTVQRILLATELESAVIKYQKVKLAERMSGKLGDSDYVASDTTKDYVRRRSSKSPKKTPKRLAQQNLMSQALDAEKEMTLNQMEKWNKEANSFNTSGANLFRGVYMRLLNDGKPIPEPFLPTEELLVYYRRRKKKSTRLI